MESDKIPHATQVRTAPEEPVTPVNLVDKKSASEAENTKTVDGKSGKAGVSPRRQKIVAVIAVALSLVLICLAAVLFTIANNRPSDDAYSTDPGEITGPGTATTEPETVYAFINGRFYQYNSGVAEDITAEFTGYTPAPPSDTNYDPFNYVDADADVVAMYNSEGTSLHLVKPTDRIIQRLTLSSEYSGYAAAYNTSNDKVYVSAQVGSQKKILEMNPDGSELRELHSELYEVAGRGGMLADDHSVRISPDGSKLLVNYTTNSFASTDAMSYELKLVSVEGEILKRIANAANSIWIDDERFVYWQSTAGGEYELNMYDVAGDSSEVIFEQAGSVPVETRLETGSLLLNIFTDAGYEVHDLDLTTNAATRLSGSYYLPNYIGEELLAFNTKECELDPFESYPEGSTEGKMYCPMEGPTGYYSNKFLLIEGGAVTELLAFDGQFAT